MVKTQQEATAITYELEKLCLERGIWYEITRENRPALTRIIVKIDIKVDNQEKS